MSVKRPLSETLPGVTEDYRHSELKRNKMSCFNFGRNGKEEKMELEDTGVATSSIETVDQLFASLNRMSEDVNRAKAFLRIPNLEGYKQFVFGKAHKVADGDEFANAVLTFHKEDIDGEDDPKGVRRSLRVVLPALYDKIKKLYPGEFPSKYPLSTLAPCYRHVRFHKLTDYSLHFQNETTPRPSRGAEVATTRLTTTILTRCSNHQRSRIILWCSNAPRMMKWSTAPSSHPHPSLLAKPM